MLVTMVRPVSVLLFALTMPSLAAEAPSYKCQMRLERRYVDPYDMTPDESDAEAKPSESSVAKPRKRTPQEIWDQALPESKAQYRAIMARLAFAAKNHLAISSDLKPLEKLWHQRSGETAPISALGHMYDPVQSLGPFRAPLLEVIDEQVRLGLKEDAPTLPPVAVPSEVTQVTETSKPEAQSSDPFPFATYLKGQARDYWLSVWDRPDTTSSTTAKNHILTFLEYSGDDDIHILEIASNGENSGKAETVLSLQNAIFNAQMIDGDYENLVFKGGPREIKFLYPEYTVTSLEGLEVGFKKIIDEKHPVVIFLRNAGTRWDDLHRLEDMLRILMKLAKDGNPPKGLIKVIVDAATNVQPGGTPGIGGWVKYLVKRLRDHNPEYSDLKIRPWGLLVPKDSATRNRNP